MRTSKLALAAVAAFALVGSPLAAAPHSAARLSVAQSVRAGTPTKGKENDLRGASLTLIVGAIAVVAGITYLVVRKKSKSP